jgi:hypothetical protein
MVGFLFLAIIATLAGRMIEVFMYLSASPLTAATFMNSEWRSTGNNWLKGLFALAFQGFFITVAIAFFVAILGGLVAAINATAVVGTKPEDVGFELVLRMLTLFAYTLALSMTVLRSGQISKSMFGAS